MVHPRIVHPNIQLTDITDRFIASAKSEHFLYHPCLLLTLLVIPTGQLIKDEGFTLFEAVGALEVG